MDEPTAGARPPVWQDYSLDSRTQLMPRQGSLGVLFIVTPQAGRWRTALAGNNKMVSRVTADSNRSLKQVTAPAQQLPSSLELPSYARRPHTPVH